MPLVSLLALLGLIVGLYAERKALAQPAFNRALSAALVQFIYPCLIFSALLLRFSWHELRALSALPLLVFVICGLGLIIGKLSLPHAGLSKNPTQRSYIFLAAMPNYSFVPLVIAQAIWGDRGLALVAVSSIGADIFLWSLAYPQIAGRRDWKKLLSPPLISILLAIAILNQGWDFHSSPWISAVTAMSWIGKATLPISMYVLGCQLARATRNAGERRAQRILMLWRLILCPLLMLLLILSFDLRLPYEAKAVALLVGSMPAAIVSVVLAQLHDADGKFAATQILNGHCWGLLSVGLWQAALYFIAG